MPEPPRHTVFVSYARDDQAWVQGYLLPALHLPDDQVITPDKFRPGASLIDEFERAIQDSRYSVLVFSPSYLNESWTSFSEQLISFASVRDRSDRLIPLVLKPCDVPLRIEFRVKLDCAQESSWDSQLQILRDHLAIPWAEPEKPACPYPGLVPFNDTEPHFFRYFFGRDAEIDDLVRRITSFQRQIFVIGPSGCGKSSLVFAGVIPRLPTGEWVIHTMTPGDNPLARLHTVLGLPPGGPATSTAYAEAIQAQVAARQPAQRVLLVVDQLEELFSPELKSGQKPFIAALQALHSTRQCVVLFTMRADFYPELMESDFWLVEPGQRFEVAPLRGEALRDAIQKPAEASKVYIEPGLLQHLLDDAADEPGCMPMLQVTMRLLWDRLRYGFLPHAAYLELGREGRPGLIEAMTLQAESVLDDLTPAGRTMARRIFMRLIQFGEGRADTRRQQYVPEMREASNDPALFNSTLKHLTLNRLITVNDDADPRTPPVVNIAHEKLILGWPTSRQWVQERRADELIRRRIEYADKEWRQNGGPLLGGRQLRETLDWDARNPGELTPDQRQFLKASQQRAQMIRGLKWAAVALAVILALILPVREGYKARLRWQAAGLEVVIAAREGFPAFYMDQYEVSYRQYHLCVQAGECLQPQESAGYDRYNVYRKTNPDWPVTFVTAYQAAVFCDWIGRRLPTSAEWSQAAASLETRTWRLEDNRPPDRLYANAIMGDYMPDDAVAVDDSRFAASDTAPEGLRHMLGNVWEWTSTIAPETCSPDQACRGEWPGRGSPPGQLYVRGLSWYMQIDPQDDPPGVTYLLFADPTATYIDFGFRCARSR